MALPLVVKHWENGHPARSQYRALENVTNVANIQFQSQSAYAKATADKLAIGNIGIGNIGTGNISTLATLTQTQSLISHSI